LALDSGTPDGTERLTIGPVAGSFYDAAGNPVEAEPENPSHNNTVRLVDQTPPVLYIHSGHPDLTNATQVFNTIDAVEFSGNEVDGIIYVRDRTPGLKMLANDAFSTEIILNCYRYVDGVEYDTDMDSVTLDSRENFDVHYVTVSFSENLSNGQYDIDSVLFKVSDSALPNKQSDAISCATFYVDSRPPEISGTAIADDNSTITVTFDSAFYNNENAAVGLVEFDDFALTTITSGAATVVLEGPAVKSGLEITIPLTITGIPDGTEEIEINPVANSIFDIAGNAATSSQNNNRIILNDKAPPILVDALGNADQIFTDIPVNVVGDQYFFSNVNPLMF